MSGFQWPPNDWWTAAQSNPLGSELSADGAAYVITAAPEREQDV